MTDHTTPAEPRVFTARVEARHATSLRAKRDLTDTDIQAEYLQRLTPEAIDAHRVRDTATRVHWEREAVVSALHEVISDANDAAKRDIPSRDVVGQTIPIIADDLEGAQITITMTDLIAEATLVLPTRSA